MLTLSFSRLSILAVKRPQFAGVSVWKKRRAEGGAAFLAAFRRPRLLHWLDLAVIRMHRGGAWARLPPAAPDPPRSEAVHQRPRLVCNEGRTDSGGRSVGRGQVLRTTDRRVAGTHTDGLRHRPQLLGGVNLASDTPFGKRRTVCIFSTSPEQFCARAPCPDIALNLEMLLSPIRNVLFRCDFSRGWIFNRMITKPQFCGFLCHLLPRPLSF